MVVFSRNGKVRAEVFNSAQGKVFSGSTDVALSDKGRESARQMSRNRLWEKIAHVFFTPLIRTHQAADILFGDGLGRTAVPKLGKEDFGEYEGEIRDSTNANDPVFYKWVHDPENLTFPQGENLLVHTKASLRALTKIANENTYDADVIISHATTISLLLATLLTGLSSVFVMFLVINVVWHLLWLTMEHCGYNISTSLYNS